MKARKTVDFVLVTLLLIFAGYFVVTRYFISAKPQKKFSKITKANDILKYKTEIKPQFLNTAITSSACTMFLKSSAEKSMVEYANEFIDHHVDDILKTCNGAFPSNLEAKINDALLKCKSSVREKITNECFAALLAAKTTSVATVIKPDVDPRDLSPTILLHLIAEKFSNGDFFEHPHVSLALVNALLDKEPSYLGGYKVKMMLLAMSNLNKEDYYKNEFQDTMDEAKRLNPADPEIRELAIAEKGQIFNGADAPKDKTSFINYLDSEAAKHPTEWIYDYYKAQTLYDNGKGNYDQTLALVEKALKKAPNDYRLKQTLESLKSDDEERRKHPFVLAIGFSLNDL
jgi:tetratricopeptide (TPR) repeat protein